MTDPNIQAKAFGQLKTEPRQQACPYCGQARVVVDRVSAVIRSPGTQKLEMYGIDLTGRLGGCAGAGVIASQVNEAVDSNPQLKRKAQGRHVVIAFRGAVCGHQWNTLINCPDPANGGTFINETDQFVSALPLPGDPAMIKRQQELPALWARLLSIITTHLPIFAQWMTLATPSWGEQGEYPMLILNFRREHALAAQALALPDNMIQLVPILQQLQTKSGIQIAVDGQFITANGN